MTWICSCFFQDSVECNKWAILGIVQLCHCPCRENYDKQQVKKIEKRTWITHEIVHNIDHKSLHKTQRGMRQLWEKRRLRHGLFKLYMLPFKQCVCIIVRWSVYLRYCLFVFISKNNGCNLMSPFSYAVSFTKRTTFNIIDYRLSLSVVQHHKTCLKSIDFGTVWGPSGTRMPWPATNYHLFWLYWKPNGATLAP
jgi:hypothetical protein